MNDKILVTYASRSGSTAEAAELIGKTLTECGATVDVLDMNAVKDLTPYRAVIAGSAIRVAKWLPEAMKFLNTHRAALNQKPFAAFMVCITLAMKDGEKYRAGVSDWMDPVRSIVRPVSVGFFAGILNFKKLPLFPDGVKMRLPVMMGIFPGGDNRDKEAVRSWARDVYPKLR
jgi:menaquinone-dependent protoporphyrinogen oxidase